MRLQTATRIAIYAVLDLAADPGRQVSAAEIAGRFDISVNHLAKVLRALGRAGLVEALRGVGGGYRFRGNVKRVTLLDVIRLFEDVGGGDGEGLGSSMLESRALRRVLDEIDDIARATLSSITLATMLKLVEQERPDAEAARPARGAAPRSAR
ncbi:MAG TPA: Rrf2 family transcriptional regulator [Anaeromyxobacteraceae bacterium]|nr:Rrf2 family transcriptional regulator [Anaeromyxobacteraceae bacterium]